MKILPLLLTILITYGFLMMLAIYRLIKDMKRTDRIFEELMKKIK